MIIFAILSTVYAGRYWVFFNDKGKIKDETLLAQRISLFLPQKTLERRIRAMGKAADFKDIPVYKPYVDSLIKFGFKPRYTSKWLNAVSGIMPEDRVTKIKKLDFVKGVKRVAVLKGKFPEIPKKLEYGMQETNIKLMNIDKLHELGYTGKGVRIGVFDTGFEFGEGAHEAMDRFNVIAKADFVFPDTVINGQDTILVPDTVVSYEQGEDWRDPSYPNCYAPFCCQTDHGTMVLSILAGYAYGRFIGVSFGADFILAKTELVYDRNGEYIELRQEEDNWIRAMEWAESLGVDIVSSSLGYRDFDDTTGYSYEDMDGKTALITLAAEEAVRRGVLVVNAMGNVRTQPPESSIVAPADGEDVLSIGGTTMEIDSLTGDTTWVWCNQAAMGPTADGRQKPDLAAPFYAEVVNPVWRTEFYNLPGGDTLSIPHYISGAGTSFSTPYIAGIAALLLEAHPSWKGNPDMIRLALISTASKNTNPDYKVGYGIPDAFSALTYLGKPEVVYRKKNYILPVYPNPFNPEKNSIVHIPFVIEEDAYVKLSIYDEGGRLVHSEDMGIFLPGKNTIKWSPGNLRTGLYVIIINTGFARLRSSLYILK